jgi:hypothetical protein
MSVYYYKTLKPDFGKIYHDASSETCQNIVRFFMSTAARKMTVFWDSVLYSLVELDQRFRCSLCFHCTV